MAKLHDTDPERLRSRIRELTDECRRLREELRKSTQDRIAGNPMANERSRSSAAPRRQKVTNSTKAD